jgi:hypothetical protein
MSDVEARVRAVEAILAREGIAGTASAVGHARDVASLAVSPEHLPRLAEVAPEIKAVGFRYVALELVDALP